MHVWTRLRGLYPNKEIGNGNMNLLNHKTVVLFLVSAMILCAFAGASEQVMPRILSLKERAEVQDRWLELRLQEVVPKIMRRDGVDMWVMIAREYNEDPVVATMLPATAFSARRRTILLFFDQGPEKGVERISVSRYDIGTFFKSSWDKNEVPDQWERLAQLIEERSPKKIAVNRSHVFALADGLSSGEFEQFHDALSPELRTRITSGEKLAIGWLETRIPEEMAVYPTICRIAHLIVREGLSERAITPGVTTTEDLEWWYRERIQELQLATWFHPSVSIQRPENNEANRSFDQSGEVAIIQPGDLIHVDFGITYLGLNTDTQEHAYVLRAGETSAPAGLRAALAAANRLQDILLGEFKAGRSGNEILAAALARANAEGITPSIYTHPLGFHGHAAGPTIGLWDQQDGVPGQGDYLLFGNTAHSIELNARSKVEEWGGKEVRMMLEQDAFFDGTTVRYIDGRQTELHLIPRPE